MYSLEIRYFYFCQKPSGPYGDFHNQHKKCILFEIVNYYYCYFQYCSKFFMSQNRVWWYWEALIISGFSNLTLRIIMDWELLIIIKQKIISKNKVVFFFSSEKLIPNDHFQMENFFSDSFLFEPQNIFGFNHWDVFVSPHGLHIHRSGKTSLILKETFWIFNISLER